MSSIEGEICEVMPLHVKPIQKRGSVEEDEDKEENIEQKLQTV